MGQDLGQSVALCDALGEIFCLTFARGVGASEALRRFGAYPDTFADLSREQMHERQTSFDLGYPRIAGAVVFGDWTVVLEPTGFQGVGPVLAEVSRGTAAVGVLRHEYAESRFVYAVDGTEMTAFLPGWMDRVWGADPQLLCGELHAVGLDPVAADNDGWGPRDAVARAVLLAASITGVMPSVQKMSGPMLSAQFDPWFTSARPHGGGVLAADSTVPRPEREALIAAVDGASPAAKRATAVAEIRRIAGILGVADTPGLAEALADAEAERFPGVPVTAPLGRAVRGWLRAAATAGESLNGPARHRMSDADRRHGYRLGWFAFALRATLYPDEDLAVRAALYSLGNGSGPLADPAAHAAAIGRLRP
ncbi:DUF6461 domain-containing protein [Dactylosporangium sp. NPDC050588]|uniref:DUF6461 domain-containing protein n=1 Tax=Dactylosporangium sp. NPDC050588 TaxID=3157211 RepID=UPI0033DE5A48